MLGKRKRLNKAEFVEFLHDRIYVENLARPHVHRDVLGLVDGRIQAFQEMLKFLGEKVES